MKKTALLLLLISILPLWLNSFYFGKAYAQIYPYLASGSSSPLLSTAYLSVYLSPYYYNTLLPMSYFGQFDPSIDLDEVSLSLDILYSPGQYRTFDPSSLKGFYQFSPSPFNYLWNSLLAGQDETVVLNPFFATPFYYPLLNKGYFSTHPAERTVPLSLYTLYSIAPHLPELFYTASQAGLAPVQSFTNALGLSLLPIL